MTKRWMAWAAAALLLVQPQTGAFPAYAAEADRAGMQTEHIYTAQALNVNDTSASDQWALYNDGTFEIEQEKNRYPVYDDPFGTPVGPGEWRWDPVGVVVEVQRMRATAGIDMRIQEAWNTYGGGKRDVVVAMIDTGIDYTHEDLKDAIWINSDEVPDNGIDDDGNGYVDDVYGWDFYRNTNRVFNGAEDSHGTHGAGTIRASVNNGTGIAGIVPGDHVRVMAVKALGGRSGSGSTSALIRAIRYAEENGASICNLSLTSTSYDQALYQAIANSSMLFVVAAGNGDEHTGIGVNTDEVPCYPASFDLDNIISVANLTFNGNLHESSNYGARTVDLAAPGSHILSTTPGNSYGLMTGTSMAAPMVAGAAAMIYSYYDGISLADTKEILLSTVTPLDSLNGKTVTGGMPNLAAALTYDLGKLSGTGFTNSGRAPEGGTPPYMEADISMSWFDSYLTLRVVDIDNDLDVLSYASGEHTAAEFAAGLQSETFSVNSEGIAIFRIGESGVYTFYARDRRGNETVKVVKIAAESDGPGAWQF